MDELKAYKLKKHEQVIQAWFDECRELGMSEDEIKVMFERMVEDANTRILRD